MSFTSTVNTGMAENFQYTYSAKQQEEIEAIRKKYLPQEEDKMEMLKKLDRKAEKPGCIAALTMGIFGTLVLGIGMCCTMVWAEKLFYAGIIIGIAGMVIAAMAYPVYKKVTKKQREKIAAQILELADELSVQA